MTPQERELVTALFDRLAALEGHPRDAEAERLIAQGLAQAPNAIYPLVQTVLLQDEALKRANARIEELEGSAEAPRGGSFLDGIRRMVSGPAAAGGRGSVPSVRPGGVWNTGQTGYGASAQTTPAPMTPAPMTPAPVAGAGGSFLGTAAAAAVGMIGGSLLFNGIRGLMGGGQSAAFGGFEPAQGNSPWGSDASGSKLGHAAGRDDIGADSGNVQTQSSGLFDQASGNDDASDVSDNDFADSDFGDDGGSMDA
jgi:uncharacterized protein